MRQTENLRLRLQVVCPQARRRECQTVTAVWSVSSGSSQKNQRQLVGSAGDTQGHLLYDSARRLFDGWWHGWRFPRGLGREGQWQPQCAVSLPERFQAQPEPWFDNVEWQLSLSRRSPLTISPPLNRREFLLLQLFAPSAKHPAFSQKRYSDK